MLTKLRKNKVMNRLKSKTPKILEKTVFDLGALKTWRRNVEIYKTHSEFYS